MGLFGGADPGIPNKQVRNADRVELQTAEVAHDFDEALGACKRSRSREALAVMARRARQGE